MGGGGSRTCRDFLIPLDDDDPPPDDDDPAFDPACTQMRLHNGQWRLGTGDAVG